MQDPLDRAEQQPPHPLPPPPGYPSSYPYGQPGQYPSPPQPPQGPPQGVRRRSGLLGWLTALGLGILGYAKYAVILLKFAYVKTAVTLLISFGAYAVLFGPWFAAALVVMILVHEMGHVVEIRRQGMQATAPIFIPFVGAAIFQRSHPTDALKQAQIGIAGPIAGTLGATAAYVLYGATHFTPLLLAAYLGFFINLFNLIPAGMLDGGWILAPVSKWFQVVGLALLAALVLFGGINPLIIIFILLGIPTILGRFRNAQSPYYTSVPRPARWAMAGAWLALVLYLGFASVLAHTQLTQFLK